MARFAPGLEKRQCRVQLTVFGDGVSRVKPTSIFWGESKRTKLEKKYSWDSDFVNLMFT